MKKKFKRFRNFRAPKGKTRVICINTYRRIRYLLGDYKHRRSALRAAEREYKKTDNCYYVYDERGNFVGKFIQPARPQPK